jgi:hypothetical protein
VCFSDVRGISKPEMEKSESPMTKAERFPPAGLGGRRMEDGTWRGSGATPSTAASHSSSIGCWSRIAPSMIHVHIHVLIAMKL